MRRHLSFFMAAAVAAAVPVWGQVKITQGSDRIMIDIDGKPFSALFTGSGIQKPYLHPLRSASGKVVSRSFPMEIVEGETRDHPHHRGLWFTHGDVNGFDFWSEAGKDKQGTVILRKILDLKSGKKRGSLTAVFEWHDPKGNVLISETRTMKFFSNPTLRIIDFDATLTAMETVKFGDTKEGMFALRLAEPLKEGKGGNGRMVNSEGAEGEKGVWGKRAAWVDYAGVLDGEKIGIAIFDHPLNLKHPTYWHARAYGLFAANPFGEHDFHNDKTRDGSVTLEKGQSQRFRYQVVIHPGDAATAGIPALYKKFAAEK